MIRENIRSDDSEGFVVVVSVRQKQEQTRRVLHYREHIARTIEIARQKAARMDEKWTAKTNGMQGIAVNVLIANDT